MAIRRPIVIVGGDLSELPLGDSLPGVSGGSGGGSISTYSYDDRENLRDENPTGPSSAIVDGLGLFVWYEGSTEPDDDESCFATRDGRWLLEAPHWDVIDSWQLFETEANGYMQTIGKCNIATIGTLQRAEFTVNVLGSNINNGVIATPLKTNLDPRLCVTARVTSPGVVTVYLSNPSASASIAGGIPTDWQILVFPGVI